LGDNDTDQGILIILTFIEENGEKTGWYLVFIPIMQEYAFSWIFLALTAYLCIDRYPTFW
jgi:hypothetical protein